MCGIVGYIGQPMIGQDVVMEGLRKLEYRGYDSCGIVMNIDNKLVTTKTVGRIKNLDAVLKIAPSNLALGHTR